MKNSELETLIYQSTKLQQLLFRGVAIAIWFGAVLMVLLILFAPFEASEEGIKPYLGGFGVVCILVGLYCWTLGNKLPRKAINLIQDSPEEISSVKHVQARKNGIVAHGVQFRTLDNKIVGVNVANAQVAERIVTLIQQELPHVEIK